MVAHGMIIKFPTTVTLNPTNSGRKLSLNKGKEITEGVKNIRFQAKWESPQVVCEIIENNEIVLVTRDASNRRGPKVTMY